MARVLMTFLGRAPRKEGRYRTTQYDFGDGKEARPLAFFGWALHERIRPERLVILGTQGSMWDHLFEEDIDLGAVEEEKRLQLVEAVEQRNVTQAQLDELAPLLAASLNCEVQLRLIPYCREEAEQTELLRILAKAADPGDEVHLDVTHAFRHLPMIGLMGALYLRLQRGIVIRRIWYGAFDPDTGAASVHDLGGLLRIADWLEALSVYEKKGDYGVFADLLQGDLADHIHEAAFLEQVNRVGPARGHARKALQQLREQRFDDPAAELFRPVLEERLRWAEQNNFYQRQRALALGHLRRGNLLEAILGAYEAFISLLALKEGLDPDNSDHREQARDLFDQAEKQKKPRSEKYRHWDELRRLRNAITHGGSARGADVQRAFAGRNEMARFLEGLINALLPEDSGR